MRRRGRRDRSSRPVKVSGNEDGGGVSAAPRLDRILDRLAVQDWLAGALLVVAIALVYANSLPNQFVFDDYELVVENTQIQSVARIPEILGFGEARRRYRPVRFISYTVDHFFFGLESGRLRSAVIPANRISARAVSASTRSGNSALRSRVSPGSSRRLKSMGGFAASGPRFWRTS